jgi:hypothetical protein
MYWCKKIKSKEISHEIPSLGRVEAVCRVAGRGDINAIGETPTSSFPREGIAQAIALFFLILLTSLLPSCKPANLQDAAKPRYFDIKGYFHADSLRLTKLNHIVTKSVTHNGVTETKQVHINNWGVELNLFIQSDINKPAWWDSYTIQNSAHTVVYRAKTPDMKTREIVINKNPDNSIKWILIYNSTQNILYQTTEKLSYFPDSLYIIKKDQKVRLLRANKYLVKGTLN